MERVVPARRAGGLGASGAPLAHRPQGTDVSAYGRDRRRADDVAAGVDRRRPQLGLPLLLAARRDAHAPRPPPLQPRRRSGRVAALADARDRRRPGRRPGHVRRRRRAAPDGVRGSVARRLRGFEAGADRQRGERAAPARRLRRAHGLPLPGARARPRRRRPGMADPARPPRAPRRRVARARTTASGRSAASRGTSSTRRRWRGWRSTARCAPSRATTA